MQMALIIIPGKILLTAHLYPLSLYRVNLSVSNANIPADQGTKSHSYTFELLSLFTESSVMFTDWLVESSKDDHSRLKRPSLLIILCWLPVKLILKHENNPFQIFVGIYSQFGAGTVGRAVSD